MYMLRHLVTATPVQSCSDADPDQHRNAGIDTVQSPYPHTKPAVDDTGVKAEERSAEKPEARKLRRVMVTEVFRQTGKTLARIVCGKTVALLYPEALV